ncbi:MAG: transglycosylase domain-containing protein, partial [Chloroflexota bacterium]|nr:transglycosylase domain-containing protein [Chloroflexota bacterium]
MYDLQPKQRPQKRPQRQPEQQPQRRPARRQPAGNPFWRGVMSGVLAFVAAVAFAFSSALIGYAMIANGLESPKALAAKVSPFQGSLKIVDRDGNLLNEAFDPEKGRHQKVPLADIPLALQQATIDTEDANFYTHRGVDPVALLRAVYYAVQEGDIVSGASTIPQQLVKMKLLSAERTLSRKINEAILSAEITRTYSKAEILEIYLNELYYGNFAFGVDAAAETYFGKDVKELTLAESAYLAGLPQAPSYYDPYTQGERAQKRQGVVLGLMVKAGDITQAEADAAWAQKVKLIPLNFDLKAPHFTLFVRQELEALFGPAVIQSGYTVLTTLDSRLQDEAQRIVHDQIATLGEHNVSNGALVAIRPETGEIVALVGSADFDNVEIDGQVNMALSPRQPGSTIKPLVYLSAFEQPGRPVQERWTPGTLIADIKEAFPDGVNPPYVPTNYDNKERGMVTARTALATSLNIPAVRAMQAVG